MLSTDTPGAKTSNSSERREQPNNCNRDRICTEEQSCMGLIESLQYTPLNVGLNLENCPIGSLSSNVLAKNETETIAKTILLTLSQPVDHNFEIQSFSHMDPGAYLKMAQKSMQRITPFQGEEPPLQRGRLPRVQIQRLINQRRNTTEPDHYQKSPPLREPRRRFSQVAIITPSLKHPQLGVQGRVCGGKEWKKALCAAKRRQQSIRKSGSVSVCQILHHESPLHLGDALQMVIKGLLPSGGLRSHSLPMKVEGRVKDYIQASSIPMKVDESKDPPIHQRHNLIREEPLLKVRKSEKKKPGVELDFRTFHKIDRSNLFRKLNAFRQKNEEDRLDQKLLRFESQYEGKRLHGQADIKLATSMGYRLTNTIYFKNRQSNSLSRNYPPS